MTDLAFELRHQIVHEAQADPSARRKRTRCQEPAKISLTQTGASVRDVNDKSSLGCLNIQTDLACVTGSSARIEQEI